MPKDELDTFQKAGGKRVLVVPYDYRVPKVRNILIILNLISFIYIFSYCPRCKTSDIDRDFDCPCSLPLEYYNEVCIVHKMGVDGVDGWHKIVLEEKK